MRVRTRLVVAVLVSLAVPAAAKSPPPVDGGWEYLIDKLTADGIEHGRVVAVFRDPAVPDFDGLPFSIGQRETHNQYRGFAKPPSIAAARRCRDAYDDELRAAEERYGVPASVVSALLHVETQCGRNTGSHLVFARLARLAMANEPDNVQSNIRRHSKGVPAARRADVERRVRQRAKELEGIFYPEVVAMFRLSDQTGVDPLAIRGSGSGAFGMPQFLPSSYLNFAVDGNGDGRVSLYDPADAAASAANYLARHGWQAGISRSQQRQVIWTYNHSDPYIATVLFLAAEIEDTHPSSLSLAER